MPSWKTLRRAITLSYYLGLRPGAIELLSLTRRLGLYDLRHAFATAALERDSDIKALSEIMGSRPETLMRTYQHVSTKLRKDAVNKIPTLADLTNCGPK